MRQPPTARQKAEEAWHGWLPGWLASVSNMCGLGVGDLNGSL